MNYRNGPPVADMQTRRAWATDTGPNLTRPRLLLRPGVPGGGGGGPVVPPGSTLVYDLRFAATLNGSKLFDVDTASAKVLDAPNTYRNFLYARNCSTAAQVIFLNFGDIATTESIIRLAQNEQIMFDQGVPQDDIYAIASAAGGRLSIGVGLYTLPT